MTKTYENAMKEAFPAIDAGIQPFGSRVLVQIRTAKTQTAGGIILDTDTKDHETWHTQIGNVMYVRPHAFKNRPTLA